MRIKIVDIPDEGLSISGQETIQPDSRAEGDPCWFPAPARYELEMNRVGTTVRVRGRVSVGVKCQCGRCLTEFPVPVASAVRLEFVPADSIAGSAPDSVHLLSGEEMNIAAYRNEEIDLADLVYEQVQLSLPMSPVCREDCRGLCPVCGANLNEAPCAGHADRGESPFSALAALMKPEPSHAKRSQSGPKKKKEQSHGKSQA
ncbi:MAG: hypothetical protein A2V83_08660 [Nitrospirae bacterium RBG_16_64_22]|nr:MAG: hypothetical protein A2V83_08660 [Nitrospirae bacterium RBG_16_64_22]